MATIQFRQFGRGLDFGLLTVTLTLSFIGLGAIFSTSLNVENGALNAFYRQGIYLILGLIGAGVIARFDYRYLGGIHWLLYGLGVASLIAVALFGRTINGTTGWFEIGGFQLQPVEFVKVIVCLVVAKYFSDNAERIGTWRVLMTSAVIVGVPILLVMAQPDLGSAILLLAVWFGLVIVLPFPRRRVLGLVLLAAVMAVSSWFVVLRPYQKDRLMNFVNPQHDPRGSGYNVQQAITAIGSGQLFGRGLGLGPQSQLRFLPERQTDFIFASIGEELGLVGTLTVLILFAILLWRLVQLSRTSRDQFSMILSIGLAYMFFVQMAINIGMNVGVFPVTGIPLPFVSYGGSSLLSCLVAIGLAESIAIRNRIIPV
jgi:rod shape determining protein RodA